MVGGSDRSEISVDFTSWGCNGSEISADFIALVVDGINLWLGVMINL